MLDKLINWKAILIGGITLIVTATLSYGLRVSAAGHSVTNITLNPPTPNILVHKQQVTVSFSYATSQPGGVRIFARPFVGNALAPGYSASGADILPIGIGKGTQNFTINSGTVTVNRIRIQMWDANQTQLLFEAFVPVHYEFRAP